MTQFDNRNTDFMSHPHPTSHSQYAITNCLFHNKCGSQNTFISTNKSAKYPSTSATTLNYEAKHKLLL